MKSIGIVGLPNIGKSTFFNVITNQSVPAENYPFCTIEKNSGVVEYKDEHLYKLSKVLESQEVFYPLIQFVDIAGLVKGASKGEGLGNQFLAHIREVDLIMYVLRAFPDKNVTHVEGSLNPTRDLDIILTELILKDIESLEKKEQNLSKQARNPNDKDAKIFLELVRQLKQHLENEKTAYSFIKELDENKKQLINSLFLLTAKPAIFVLNVSYFDFMDNNYTQNLDKWQQELKEYISQKYDDSTAEFITRLDAKFLLDSKNMNPTEIEEIKKELPFFADVNTIITLAKNKLNLINFYIGNKKDARSFFLENGSTIVKAASYIHQDLADN